MKRPRRPPATRAAPADERFAWPAVAIFSVALVVRLIHLWQIHRAPFFTVLMGDARAYDTWAQEIARGDWVGHEVFYQAPLYPYFLGAIYAIAGRDLTIVRICQAIMGSLSCVLLALAGRRLFSKRVGVIAGFALALYAPAIFFDGLVQKSVLDVFFICLALWLLSGLVVDPSTPVILSLSKDDRRSGRGRRLSWLWLGLAMGGLSLTRENALVFIGVILLWALLARRHLGNQRFVAAGIFLLGLAIVLLPVAARNRRVGGGFYLATSQFGPNFYIGNNERTDGTYMPLRFGRGAPEYERQDATELAERAAGRHLTPAEVSRYWTEQALAYIRSHPARWLKLLGRKAMLVWNATEMLDTESQASHAEWSTPVRLAGWFGHFGVLVPLALFGIWATWAERSRLWLLYAMLMAYAASVVMFYVFARYRYPLVPFLALFAAAGLASASRFFRTSPVPQIAGSLTAVAAAAVFVNWPLLSDNLMRATTETNLGAALQSDGRVDEATDHYRRALEFEPDYAPAHSNLGAALRAQGRADEAVEQYRQALRIQPEYPDAHYNLANVFLAQGRSEEAIDHFRRALQSMPGSVDAHNNLGIALAAEGKFDEAITEFREALRLEPDSAKSHRNLGNALESAGVHDEALVHLRRAVQLEPDEGAAHYDLASALLEGGELEEAIDQFGTALRLMPDSVEAHNNLGIALASQGKLDEAIDHFKQALKLQPEFADARRNLALALRARTQLKGAR